MPYGRVRSSCCSRAQPWCRCHSASEVHEFREDRVTSRPHKLSVRNPIGPGREDFRMKPFLLLIGLALSAVPMYGQGKPVIVVNPFTTAAGVELPYDMKLLQSQIVPELKVMLSKEFDVVADAPATGTIYTLDAEITGWRPGNAAKRILVGMGSGREASDLAYRVSDRSGRNVLERKDTIRTNFYAQSGSTGTLAHPIAQKIADRIKDAKLK